jgi:hypothetical protein
MAGGRRNILAGWGRRRRAAKFIVEMERMEQSTSVYDGVNFEAKHE